MTNTTNNFMTISINNNTDNGYNLITGFNVKINVKNTVSRKVITKIIESLTNCGYKQEDAIKIATEMVTKDEVGERNTVVLSPAMIKDKYFQSAILGEIGNDVVESDNVIKGWLKEFNNDNNTIFIKFNDEDDEVVDIKYDINELTNNLEKYGATFIKCNGKEFGIIFFVHKEGEYTHVIFLDEHQLEVANTIRTFIDRSKKQNIALSALEQIIKGHLEQMENEPGEEDDPINGIFKAQFDMEKETLTEDNDDEDDEDNCNCPACRLRRTLKAVIGKANKDDDEEEVLVDVNVSRPHQGRFDTVAETLKHTSFKFSYNSGKEVVITASDILKVKLESELSIEEERIRNYVVIETTKGEYVFKKMSSELKASSIYEFVVLRIAC